MIKINIKNVASQQITNSADFPTMEIAQAWIAEHSAMGSFGKPEHTIQVIDTPEVRDAWGNILAQATHKNVVIPSEFTVEITDITAELEQAAINEAALKYLAETDFYIIRELDNGVPCPEDIKLARQAARDSIVRL